MQSPREVVLAWVEAFNRQDADAATVTGHILYVDGGAHFGRW
jgi:hypothetical protein